MLDSQGPTEAFEALGHPMRVDVLAAVAEAQRAKDLPYPIGFAELRRLAGVEVSSQFNYHLHRLRGRFVRKDEQGYQLTYAGWEVTRAMVGGTFADVEIDRIRAPGSCPNCGARELAGAFRDDWAVVTCEGCERDLVRYTFPPAAAEERDQQSFLDALDARIRAHADLARRGVCPECAGEMRAATRVGDPGRLTDHETGFVCDFCGNRLFGGVGFALLGSSVVESFLRSQGVDASSRRCWEFAFFAAEDGLTVRSTSPWRGVVEVAGDGETLAIHLDDAFDVRFAMVR